MFSSPEKRLVEAILKQLVKDYVKLNPNSDLYSAEFYENEGKDYKSAEDILFNNFFISYGDWKLTFEEICLILDLDMKRLKKFIFKHQIHHD